MQQNINLLNNGIKFRGQRKSQGSMEARGLPVPLLFLYFKIFLLFPYKKNLTDSVEGPIHKISVHTDKGENTKASGVLWVLNDDQ